MINGERLTPETAYPTGNRADQFVFADHDEDFSQMKKNTVSAENQLCETEFVTFEDADQRGPRILFLGNSITLHDVKESIGWHHRHGMAASAKEKDYVHLLMKKFREKYESPAFCICQASAWEKEYQNGTEKLSLYEAAQAFQADIIIFRLVENCPYRDFNREVFRENMKALLDFLNPSGKAKILLTTSFWRHPASQAITEFAGETGLPLAELSDLGQDGRMKALGLFEHSGVANHPGDLGMEMIAKRIWKAFEAHEL